MRRRDKRRRAKAKRIDTTGFAFAKTATSDPKVNVEAIVIAHVRAVVEERDGGCRFPHEARWRSACQHLPDRDSLDWAHRHGWTRAQTRGMAPEERHISTQSMMLCRRHHQDYDQHRIIETAVDEEHGADGVLLWHTTSGEFLGES